LAVNQTTSRLLGEPSPVTASPSVGYSSAGIVPYLENSSNGTDSDDRENGLALAVIPSNSSALTVVPASGDNKISPYAEAIQNPPDPKNLNLDPKASAACLRVLEFVKNSVRKVFNFASGIAGDAIPAAGYALNQAGTSKKTNSLLTYLTLGGSGFLALTSATNFINALKTLFKWQTSEVPGVVDFINGLAKLGFAGLFASKAMAAEPIKKDEIVYGGAGLVLFKFIEDGMRGVGPFASIPGVKDLIYFTRDSIKALGSGSGQGTGKAPGAPA
jgi:hypothetical protein